MISFAPKAGDSLVLEGRVVSPTQGIDESLRLTVKDGVISAHRARWRATPVIAPAFVDPHVHLRTPGREDEETIAIGDGGAAAAGGFCAILAMPNTGSGRRFGSRARRPRRRAREERQSFRRVSWPPSARGSVGRS